MCVYTGKPYTSQNKRNNRWKSKQTASLVYTFIDMLFYEHNTTTQCIYRSWECIWFDMGAKKKICLLTVVRMNGECAWPCVYYTVCKRKRVKRNVRDVKINNCLHQRGLGPRFHWDYIVVSKQQRNTTHYHRMIACLWYDINCNIATHFSVTVVVVVALFFVSLITFWLN